MTTELLDNRLIGERLPRMKPGDIIREDFLEPIEMSPEAFARALRLPIVYVNKLLDGIKPINDSVAGRLSGVLGGSPQYWLNLQEAYNKEEDVT